MLDIWKIDPFFARTFLGSKIKGKQAPKKNWANTEINNQITLQRDSNKRHGIELQR